MPPELQFDPAAGKKMNLIRCSQGHFYDSDRYPTCPHCGTGYQAPNPDATVSAGPGALNTRREEMPSTMSAPRGGARLPLGGPIDNDETVSFYKSAIGMEPVVGWLVCVEGSSLGRDYRLISGRNFIGRGKDQNVCIEGDNSVSRSRHAIVVYEPRGNQFLVQPGESRELCYLNDELVLSPMRLRQNDVLTLGSTKLMFIPCCSETFKWSTEENGEEN